MNQIIQRKRIKKLNQSSSVATSTFLDSFIFDAFLIFSQIIVENKEIFPLSSRRAPNSFLKLKKNNSINGEWVNVLLNDACQGFTPFMAFTRFQVHFLSRGRRRKGVLCEEHFAGEIKTKAKKKIIKILWWLIRFYSQVLWKQGMKHLRRVKKLHNYEWMKKNEKCHRRDSFLYSSFQWKSVKNNPQSASVWLSISTNWHLLIIETRCHCQLIWRHLRCDRRLN